MKGERMIILRGLLPVFVSYVIYKKGKKARASEIVKGLEDLYGKEIPKSLVFTTLRRLIRYGVVIKQNEGNKVFYLLTDDGEAFLIRHVEILKRVHIVIGKVIDDMENKH